MALMDDIKKTGKNIAQKTSDLIEIQKLNMSISQQKDKINKLYSEIGAAAYQEFKAGNDIGFTDKFNEIDAFEEKIDELQNKLMQLENSKKCPGCGSEIGAEDAFCPKCGTKAG